MNKKELRQVTGLVLWWAEGTKKRRDKRWKNLWIYSVEVTNTDPRVLKMFLDFLRKDIGIDENRLKVQIQIHEGDNKDKLERFWSGVTNVPLKRFNKTIIRPVGNKIGKSSGTCKIRYNDKQIYQEMEKMLTDRVFKLLLKE